MTGQLLEAVGDELSGRGRVAAPFRYLRAEEDEVRPAEPGVVSSRASWTASCVSFCPQPRRV